MPLSDLYKPLSRLRQHSSPQADHTPHESVDREADMLSRDKNKQKEAIKCHLAAKIRNDWVFKWPQVSDTASPESTVEPEGDSHQEPASLAPSKKDTDTDTANEDTDDDNDDAASVYSIVTEDPDNFLERADWTSEWTDEDDEDDEDEPSSPSAYRFESPDAIGSAIKDSRLERSAKHRRADRAEMVWNTGLACFNARREAWTGARVARVRPKLPTSSVSSSPTKRLSFWRRSISTTPSSPTDSAIAQTTLSPTATRTSGDTTAVASSDNEVRDPKIADVPSQYPVRTLLPIAPPLIPAANIMRASVTPANYSAIYDKIVLNALTPGCPINLSDVLRSCVVGWKRDGEWPPKSAELPPVVAVKKKRKDSVGELRSMVPRRLSLNFLGRRLSTGGDPNAASPQHPPPDQDDPNATKGGVKKSLQRVLGFGPERT